MVARNRGVFDAQAALDVFAKPPRTANVAEYEDDESMRAKAFL